MDKAIKRKWVKALRSGKYKQGKGHLKDERGRFCCLGVLCNIIDPKGWSSSADDGGFAYTYDEETEDGEIPSTLRHKVGISFDHTTHLITMNDGREPGHYEGAASRRRFSTIATWIEENL